MVDGEPVQGLQSGIADQNGDAVLFLQVDELVPDALPFVSDHLARAVGLVFLKIMGQNALPVGLAGVVQRVPMPVLHHVGTARQVRVGLQAQLPVIGKPLRKALALRLEHQIVAALYGARQVAAEGDLHAGQLVLRRMINIRSHDRHGLPVLVHIRIRIQAVGITDPVKVRVVRDELILPQVRLDDAALPCEELCRKASLVCSEFCAEAPVDRAAHIRKVLPGVDPVAPVVQPVGMV